MNNSSIIPVPAAPRRVIVPVPPEPSLELVAPVAEPLMISYRRGKELIIENGALLPTGICIKTGRPVYRVREISLRNPSNPLTWFGRRPTVEVGLSRKHDENHSIAVALTWSVLPVGAILMVVGILSLSAVTITVGFLAMALSGVVRATSPLTSSDATESYATIVGACELYLRQFPVRTERE